MAVPTYEALMLPLLQLAADGREQSQGEVLEALASRFQVLPEERAQLLPSGTQPVLYNRVHWARTYLKKAGLLERTGRGRFRITAQGLDVLARQPSQIDGQFLKQFPAFVAFQGARRVAGGRPAQRRQSAPAAAVVSEVVVSAEHCPAQPRKPAPGGQADGIAGKPPVAPALTSRKDGNGTGSALTFANAVEQVLEQYGGGRPMHYRHITTKALEAGLVRTVGQTPEQTLYAQVLSEIARDERQGRAPRFVKHGRGMIGLSRLLPRGLAAQIEEHNHEVKTQLHGALLTMGPGEFEALIGQLLARLGFEEVEVTARSGDGGIDVRGTLVVGSVIRTRMAVQVKRWRANNVQAPTVQQVRGSLGTHDQGLIITTSDFSAGARVEAERPNAVPVALMHGAQLVDLLVDHEIGVRRAAYDLLTLDGDAPGSGRR